MEQTQHTPGQWAIERAEYRSPWKPESSPDIVLYVDANDTDRIAQVIEPYRQEVDAGAHEAEANARLIAAAPEMLKALIHADTALRESKKQHKLTGDLGHATICANARISIYSAISAARGDK